MTARSQPKSMPSRVLVAATAFLAQRDTDDRRFTVDDLTPQFPGVDRDLVRRGCSNLCARGDLERVQGPRPLGIGLGTSPAIWLLPVPAPVVSASRVAIKSREGYIPLNAGSRPITSVWELGL